MRLLSSSRGGGRGGGVRSRLGWGASAGAVSPQRIEEGFDARQKLQVQRRLRLIRSGAGASGLTTTSRARGRGLVLNRTDRGGLKTFRNFTIVTPTEAVVAGASGINLRLNSARRNLRRGVTKTIDNSRVTVTSGSVSKTIMNSPSLSEGIFAARKPFGAMRSATAVGKSTTPMRISIQRGRPMATPDESMETESDLDEPTEPPAPARRPPPPPPRAPVSGRLGPDAKPKFRVLFTNLAATVSEQDVKELSSSIDGLVSSRLVEPGLGEAVYASRAQADRAVAAYDGRELDRVPMRLQLVTPGDQSGATAVSARLASPASARLASPAAAAVEMDETNEGSLPALRAKIKQPTAAVAQPGKSAAGGAGGPDPDLDLISQALFQTAPKDNKASSSVTFTVKI